MTVDYGRPFASRQGIFGTRAAFTLVELLVVMAIISVLAAMLMPSLAKAREAARQTQCLSNQKQLGLIFHVYADDFGDYCPPYEDSALNWKWHQILHNNHYLGNYSITLCPNDITPWYDTAYRQLSFAINLIPSVKPNSKRFRWFPAPAKTMLVADMSEWVAAVGTGAIHGAIVLNPWLPTDGEELNYIARRHNGSFDALYMDGHVASSPTLPSSDPYDPFWGYHQ